MTGVVADASACLPWFFRDETNALSGALLLLAAQPGRIVVPALWPLEMANVLQIGARRGRLSPSDVEEALESLAVLAMEMEHMTRRLVFRQVAPIAQQHGLTIYDACYLELAIRRGLPLATMDRRLQDAAERAGVPLASEQRLTGHDG